MISSPVLVQNFYICNDASAFFFIMTHSITEEETSSMKAYKERSILVFNITKNCR